MSRIKIDGIPIDEILTWPPEYFDELVLIDTPIIINVGSAEVLGQFAVENQSLIIELASIDGGGEGVLLALSRLARYVARLKMLDSITCIVHAINCAKPNLKLRAFLEKSGFEIKHIPNKGDAYYKEFAVAKVR